MARTPTRQVLGREAQPVGKYRAPRSGSPLSILDRYDLLTPTLQLIQQGHLDFTIDQQPYLQGFYPVLQLFFYKLSGGLVAPSDTNTGLLFVTKANVKPYLSTLTWMCTVRPMYQPG